MIHEHCHSQIIAIFHTTKKLIANKIIKLC